MKLVTGKRGNRGGLPGAMSLAVCVSSIVVLAGSAHGEPMYAVDGSCDCLYVIETNTGNVVTEIGPLHPDDTRYTTPVAMAVRPSDGAIFVWNNSPDQDEGLSIVDPATGLATLIGGSGTRQALAFDTSDVLYVRGAGGELATLDTTTGVETSLGGPVLPGLQGLDFNPADGLLYGISGPTSTPDLLVIDPSNGDLLNTIPLSQPVGGTAAQALVFARNGSLIGSDNGNQLFDIDPATGTVFNFRSTPAGFVPQGLGHIVGCPPGTQDVVPLLLIRHTFMWTDPESGGMIRVTENVYEGCPCNPDAPDPFGCGGRADMMWEYVVENRDYDPDPPVTNGLSGFQLLFPGPVPELCNQQSPAVGGPWERNAFSGQFPPFGVEWDAPWPGAGILPGETGVFRFCSNERFDVIVESEGAGSGPAGWAHTWTCFDEPIIDADGTASAGDGVPGSVELTCGDPIVALNATPNHAGLDVLNPAVLGPHAWVFGPVGGDDIHLEDPSVDPDGAPSTCPTANRNAQYDAGADCVVLDLDASLFHGQPVSCDNACDPLMSFQDLNGNGWYNDGEDIVLDLDQGSWFGTTAQTFIFHGFQSVPGEMFPEQRVLGQTCDSDRHILCKKVKYADEDDDGLIEVGEPIRFRQFIVVQNPSPGRWFDTVVTDRFGAELDCDVVGASHGRAQLTTKGRSAKEFLEWEIGMVPPGGVATLELECRTDLNPAGAQEYSECSYHEFNSGAVLKFRGMDGKQRSFESGQIIASVLTVDALGDCDEDGFTDAEELECGTDPHIPAVDQVIDADGTASAGDGIPAAVDTPCGALLSDFPVTGTADAGLDWFDNDNNGRWTFGLNGDDLHSEDPNTCQTAIRDGLHQLGQDCKVLDYDASLFTGQQVNCDLEVNAPFTEPHLSNGGCPSALNNIRYYDANGDGSWDDGEDIIMDRNGNGIFD